MAKPVNWQAVAALTPGLKNFGMQFNRRFPNREGAADGAWGDYAHSQGTSGHNPDDTPGSKPEWEDADKTPDVRAIDADNRLNEPGTTMQTVINHLRYLPNLDTVFRYMIYDEKIYEASNNFKPKPYTGASPHKEHAHFSGARTEASDQNTTFNFQLDKIAGGLGVGLPVFGDSGEDVIFWQYMHNRVRGAYTPNLPTLTVDGQYGAATATAVAAFWTAVGGSGSFDGKRMLGWLAMNYHSKLAEIIAAQMVPTSIISDQVIKNQVNDWLRVNFGSKPFSFTGTIAGSAKVD